MNIEEGSPYQMVVTFHSSDDPTSETRSPYAMDCVCLYPCGCNESRVWVQHGQAIQPSLPFVFSNKARPNWWLAESLSTWSVRRFALRHSKLLRRPYS